MSARFPQVSFNVNATMPIPTAPCCYHHYLFSHSLLANIYWESIMCANNVLSDKISSINKRRKLLYSESLSIHESKKTINKENIANCRL